MMDLSDTIASKSDQLNADDLIGGPMTITIVNVTAVENDNQQPIAVDYGVAGKTYKPCKSMRRVMVAVWGKDGKAFIGRSMTLYRDPSVTWGGVAVGGIRISHMSHIDTPVTLVMAKSKMKREPFKVLPLQMPAAIAFDEIADMFPESIAYLQSIGWLKEGQQPNELHQEAIERIAGNKTGFIEQVRTFNNKG